MTEQNLIFAARSVVCCKKSPLKCTPSVKMRFFKFLLAIPCKLL